MVFTAMATDYFPRLSSVAADNLKSNQLINQQAEIAILILAPILAILIVFINWIVIALYSSKFVAITGMIIWSALGMYFKAASWSVAFVLLAKGASRLYFWNELLGNIYILGFSLLGYKLAGLEGLGISFLISYFTYLFQVYLITRIKYGFGFQKSFYQLAGLQFILGIICIIVIKIVQTPWTYIISGPVILCSLAFSFQQLDKRIDLKRLVVGKFNNLTARS
jgi:O-antigen/teichoic acid export membrane protein